jgi:TfoX/Sxy family transcriptional regulator of competence genes
MAKSLLAKGDDLMGKAAAAAPADKVELYEKLVATNPKVKRKGAALPYTSLNGHMFSLMTKTGTLALRLPADAREEFLEKYKTKLSEQYGVVLKEYVDVPDALLKKTQELKKFFDLSYAYVGSLKPKPTTSTKKKPPKKK